MSRISRGLASVPADLTLAYTTDDPAITPDNTITIADGDAAMTRADFQEGLEECVAKINAILAYLEAASEDVL